MKNAILSLFTIAALSITHNVLADDKKPDVSKGKDLYTTKACASCHGADAKSSVMPIYPKLAGQNADYTYQQLIDFKSGARSNGQGALMKAMVQTIEDDGLRAIADYIATLEP